MVGSQNSSSSSSSFLVVGGLVVEDFFRGISPATLHWRDENSGSVRAEIPLRPWRRDCHVCFTPGFCKRSVIDLTRMGQSEGVGYLNLGERLFPVQLRRHGAFHDWNVLLMKMEPMQGVELVSHGDIT